MTAIDKFYASCQRGDLDCLDLLDSYDDKILEQGLETAIAYQHYKITSKICLHIKNFRSHELLIRAIENDDLEVVKAICVRPLNLFEPSDFVNPLISCMEEENYDIFDFLISLEMSTNDRNKLLNIAVQLNLYKFVEYLLQSDAIDPLYLYQGKNCLKYAIRKGNLESLKVLLKDKRIKVQNEDLEQAARKENGEIMKILLSYYPNDITNYEELIEITSRQDHREVLNVLFHDLRINPWLVQSSSVNIKQILEKAKNYYGSLQEYEARYKFYQQYFEECDYLKKLEESHLELKTKEVDKNNLGYEHIIKCLDRTRFVICDLKRKLGLLC